MSIRSSLLSSMSSPTTTTQPTTRHIPIRTLSSQPPPPPTFSNASSSTLGSATRYIRYKHLVSPRVDPLIYITIGLVAYHLHERDALKEPGDEDRRLARLVGRKLRRMWEGVEAPPPTM
ncbi:hypothetical protein HDU76_002340 [Blyttiomyces sp. JEL0837]|nr:hypothetical protein HDU76_002340 [Blyttiomyces sp. JEL0837]